MDTFAAPTAARLTVEEAQTTMRVRKRNGEFEPVDINKIVRAISRCTPNLPSVDTLRIATKTISGLYDGATTKELDKLSIQTAASLIFEEPEYSRLGARLLNQYIEKEVRNQEIHSFSQSIAFGVKEGLIAERVAKFVTANSRKLNDAIDNARNELFEFFAKKVGEMRHDLRIEQRPRPIGFDAAHKDIRDPVREVQVVRPSGLVPRVVTQLEKIFDVGVPRFEINAACAFSFAALIYGRDRRIQSLEPGHDPIRMPIRSAN